MINRTTVSSCIEAIISLAQELQSREGGTAEEQQAFWLMVNTRQLVRIESELFDTTLKIQNEVEGKQ